MKNKGVIISIGLILIIGVLVTVGTRRFVTDGKSQDTAAPELYQSSVFADARNGVENSFGRDGREALPETAAGLGAELGAGAAGRSSVDAGARAGALGSSESDQMAAAVGGTSASQNLDGALPETDSLPSGQDGAAAAGGGTGAEPDIYGAAEKTPDSSQLEEAPASRSARAGNSKALAADQADAAAGSAGEPDGSSAVPETAASKEESYYAIISPLTGSAENSEKSTVTVTEEDYKKRLQDVDSRIQKMKESGVVPNTDTCKNMAEYEYRLWDSELNAIYKDIISGMTEEEAELLRGEERQWMKNRDETARKAASKYSGGSIESMEYTASLADSTRSRAYQLLEDYGDYLPVVYTITESKE